MSSIGPDINLGFLTLAGTITQQLLNTVQLREAPLSVSFGPRTTPPGLVSNKIDDTVSNTCTYRGIKYNLVDIQICAPIHKSYNLPGNREIPVAELILTFYKSGSQPGYAACLLSLPIFISSIAQYDTYIRQLIIQPADKTTYGTLQTLFYSDPPLTPQTSFGYKTLVQSESANGNNYTDHMLYVLVFPNGIHTTQDIYNSLLQKIGKVLPTYSLSASVLNGDTKVVYDYTTKNGAYSPSNTNYAGMIKVSQFNITTQPFGSVYEYFLYPPKLPPGVKGGPSHCIAPSQYKCMPLQSIKGAVDFTKGACTAKTVTDDIAEMSNKLKPTQNNLPPNTENNTNNILIYIAVVIGFIVIGGILVFIISSIIANPKSGSNSNSAANNAVKAVKAVKAANAVKGPS